MPNHENMPQTNDLSPRFEKRFAGEPGLRFIDDLFAEMPELELYLVGGMVRDLIIKHPTSKDYDFVARGVNFHELIDKLKRYGQVDLVGKNFAVIKFMPHDWPYQQPIDIALPRTEIAVGSGGYRDVDAQADPTLPIEADLARRDLTMNAIAWDMRRKVLVDPYNGAEDLRNKLIRSVGNPYDRFQEDYSRMLRALRFACRFNARIEEKTLEAIAEKMPCLNDKAERNIVAELERKLEMETKEKNKADLRRKIAKQKKEDPDATTYEFIVPRETVFTEILKCFKEDPVMALEILNDSGALDLLLPEVVAMQGVEQPPEYHAEGDVWTHTRLMLSNLSSDMFRNQFPDYKPSGEFAMAVLFHDIGKPGTQTFPTEEGGRIRFDGHDMAGVRIITDIAKRFKVPSHIADMWKFCCGQHMFTMSAKDVRLIRLSKIASRFLDSPYSNELFMLFHLDSSATVRPDGTLPMENFNATVELLAEIKAIREKQPKKILDGNEILDFFGLTKRQSTFVGVVIQVLSEYITQGKINSKDEAMAFLSKHSVIFADAIANLDKIIERQDAGEEIRFNNDEMAEKILKELTEAV